MVDKGIKAIDACDDYFNEFAKEHGKSGFIYLKHNDTNQLVIYTRGEYTEKILRLMKLLNKTSD